MAARRMWLRAGYEVRARLPRRPWGVHGVSEMVAVTVPVADPDDHPVALRLDRGMPPTARDERRAWAGLGGVRDDPGDMRQSFEFRRDPDEGLLCPVMGPDGTTPVGVAAVEAAAERLNGLDRWRLGRDGGSRRVTHDLRWLSYPGIANDGEREPVPQGAEPFPPWAFRDIAGMGFADVDADSREAGLAAFRSRVSGLREIEGALWRPTAMPSLVLHVDPGIAPVARVPGHDVGRLLNHGMPHLVQVDLRVGAELGLDGGPGRATFDFVEDLPHADLARANLATLREAADWAMAHEPVTGTPGPVLRFLGDLAEVPLRLAAGEGAAAVEAGMAAALRDMHAVLVERGVGVDARGRGMGQVWAMRRWADGVAAQAAARGREAEPSEDLVGFRP